MAEAAPAVINRTIDLPVQPLAPEAFAPFGQVIAPIRDGKVYGPDDAQLDINRGIPRFYIMALKGPRPPTFRYITRHLAVTQCLASCGSKPWLIAVAPPNDPDSPDAKPDPTQVRAFHVPGTLGIKLHRSTWHVGPFYAGDAADFFNLELSNTNQVDHHPVKLDKEFGVEFRLTGPLAKI